MGSTMVTDVSQDQFALIRVEGLHCHTCERRIQRALLGLAGVNEVEVDFASGQASVLYDAGSVSVPQLMQAVSEAGYRPTGFAQGDTNR
jgi:copper chaperone CopZ